MASTVDGAFGEFLRDKVRLDRVVSDRANASRDWLITQLHSLADGSTDLPDPYEDRTYPYGSFARKTKIRELDDIDLILALKANGTTYSENGREVSLHVPDDAKGLRSLCNEGTGVLNSKRVINRILKELARVPQYSRSEMKRNGSAAVLNLASHTWAFDIVPAFFTTQEADGRNYYLIPDGNGSWMKTDPRIDDANTKEANRYHDGYLLDLIRLAKYWNGRPTMPSLSSYLLECFVLEFASTQGKLLPYSDINIIAFLEWLSAAIHRPIVDPKSIDGDINNVDFYDKLKVAAVASRDALKGREARIFEGAENHRSAIQRWRDVFGDDFPTYTGD